MELEWTMPSMVSANRFINMFVLPLVIVAYGVFLWIDHNAHNSYWYYEIKVHMQNVKNIGRVDGLVFGGSNAVYSLSAESLSYFTGVKWYNASVRGELFDIKRNKNFIKAFSARIDRTKVRYVVYSSFVPFKIGEIAVLKSDNSEKEINGLGGIKPKESVLQYIKHGNMNPQRNSYGDLVFDDRVKCVPGATTHVREDIDIAVDFLVDMAIFFTSVFPDASIQIVLPSDYYGLSFDDSIFEETLRKKFYGFLPEKYLTNSMKIIFQPPYSSIAQVCTPGGHANEDGRLWRTRNLIESMFDTPQQQISIR
jgi:hypothetical protein